VRFVVEQCAVTADGRYRVYLYPDHTAELSDIRGRKVSGREPLFLMGRKLVELGYGIDELIAE
jgi:hypothetical protein